MSEGIVCKVWNISATQKKGSNLQLGDSINYILDEEKTEAILASETQEHFNEKQLGRECQYIENDVKTIDGAYVAVQNLVSADVTGAVKEMMDVKKFYGKLGGRAALHGIISLPVEESGKEHAGELMAMCADVMRKVFPNHQAIFAVHTNTDNLHIHFVVNSVGLDGKKIHQPKNFINDVLHPCINEFAPKYGFTPNLEWDKPRKKNITDYVELKMNLRKSIDLAIEGADSFDEFIENMKLGGFQVNCGKHISVKNKDMEKAVRTYQLGDNYTKQAIIDRIMSRKLAFEKLPESDALRAMVAQSEKFQDGDIYDPTFTVMKKYRDMSVEERRMSISQLKSGINPWRRHTATSWQMKEIADNLNMTVRANKYIKAYSQDGTVEAALKGILELKKDCANEKKKLKKYIHSYKPLMDIYQRMQKIERKSYLYEHEGRTEYRNEYEEYRELTRRLKKGYNKSVSDVAEFAEAYEQQYMLLNAQIQELSQEYRELKKYAETRGYCVSRDKGLWETLGIDDMKNEIRKGVFDTGIQYLVSENNPNVMIRIVKNPYVDSQGRTQENISVSLLSRYGEILEKHNLSDGSTDKEIADAIQNYVRDKITSDETIEAIQKLLNTDKTGKELVAAVKTAIENAGDENPSDDVADPDSNNYKTGYQRGYEEGVTAGAAGKTDDKVVNMQSESYKQGYSTGYNQGYAKALTDNPNSDGNGSSSSDYSALKDQINGLTSQVTNLTTKNSQLQSKVDKLEDDVDDLEKDNKKLSSANSSLEEKNSSLSSQVNSLNSELSGLKTTNTNLTSQVTELNSKNGSLSNQVTDLTTKNNSLTSEMSTLRTQVNNANRNTTTPAASSTSKQENKTTASDTKDAASKEQRKEEADNGDVIEGSTNNLDTKTETKSTAVPDALVGSTVAAENSQKRLGTTSEVSMFSDTEINTIPGTQYATGKVIRFAESNPIVKFSDTNGKEINDITDDSLENIYKIFNYYANHLEELGNLGSDEVINAANDESKAVILSLVGAGDIKPNVTQETAFRNNRSAILNLKFPNITTGALYLVVHERADQAGQYEVCLTTATDNSLSLNVSSLSPVAVAKVEIKDATAVVNSTFTEDVEAMNTEKPAETNTGGFRVVMTVLIILMLLVSVGIVVILKLKREGKLPQFLSFLYN